MQDAVDFVFGEDFLQDAAVANVALIEHGGNACDFLDALQHFGR
jgi:hypothetical protein